MKIYVKDANLIFDLFHGGVLDAWFALGYETVTTSLVLVEIRDPDQRKQIQLYLDSGHLRIEDTTAEDWTEITDLSLLWKVSVPDASVAILAKRAEACLLTGDGRLRKKSIEVGMDVRGTLWVLDHLLEQERITVSAARTALEAIHISGTFLPQDEVENRLNKWR
jgi:predicted nucleic acid-binding protein